MRVSDVNTEFLDKGSTQALIDELKAYIDKVATGSVDLTSYVTKQELQAKLDALDIKVDLSAYATKQELQNAITSIDLSAYATKQYVTEEIAKIQTGGSVDLSNYYTKQETYSKTEVDGLIPTVKDGKDGITPHIDPVTKHWVIDKTDTGILAEGKNGIDGKDGAKGTDGLNGKDGINGLDGKDGFSPTCKVVKQGTTATITCTDATGTTTATITDGKDGASGSGGGALEVYSTDETQIGTWIDGKPLYRKVFDCGNLPFVSSGNYEIATAQFKGMLFDVVTRMTALLYIKESDYIVVDGSFQNLMLNPSTSHSTYIQNAERCRAVLVGGGNSVKLWYGADWGGRKCYIIVEYTKS